MKKDYQTPQIEVVKIEIEDAVLRLSTVESDRIPDFGDGGKA